MKTQEELYNAKGDRIDIGEGASAGRLSQMDSKNIVIAVLMGLCAGWLASWIIGPGGIFQYLVSGVLGSFVGSYVLQKFNISLGIRNEIGRDIATATIGAIIVMVVAKMLT
jgi:uncharacterized membrane protein YeaQ/YmgE (transglycosylase-associated protein family)